jgi:hypothetical protein
MKSNSTTTDSLQTDAAAIAPAGLTLTLPVLNHLILLMGQQADEDIAWSETVKAPTSGEAFATEAIFVIANSGMKHTVAAGIFKRCMAALKLGEPVSGVFGHKGKAAAMETIWRDRDALLAAYLVAEDKLAYLESLPWVGAITKYHLAKSCGLNFAKPDVHLQRLAQRQGTTVQALCEDLALQSGLRAATIDLLLWRASATGFLDSRTGRVLGLDEKGQPENLGSSRAGLFTSLIDPAAIEELDRLALVVDVDNPATCVNCGCTDRQACADRCYWVSVNREEGTGLCSSCIKGC